MGLQNKSFSDIITFTRASGGTSFRPVGYGPELVTNGDFSGGTTGWTSTNGAIAVVGGELEVGSAGGLESAEQAISVSPGKSYLLTYQGRRVGGADCSFALKNTDNSNAYFFNDFSIQRSVSIQVTPTGTTLRINAVNFTAGTQFFVDNISVKEIILDRAGDPIQLFTSPTNVPRVDYDPATGACKGLLIEEQRTNLVANSIFTGTTGGTNPVGWSVTGSGDSGQLLDVEQVLGVETKPMRITAGSVGFRGIQANMTLLANTTYSISAYVRKRTGVLAGGQLAFYSPNQVTGLVEIASTTQINEQQEGVWVRRTASFTTLSSITGTIASLIQNSGAIGTGFDFALPQIELGAFPTSYIPTTGASATRAADVATINTLSPWYNSAEGTLYVEGSWVGVPPTAGGIISVSDGSTSNELRFAAIPPSNKFLMNSGGSNVAEFSLGTSALGAFKVAAGIATNNTAASWNGSAAQVDTSCATPANASVVKFGTTNSGATASLLLKAIRYIPKRLTDAQLQAMTA